VILTELSMARAFGPPSIEANREGVKLYNAEDYPGAFKDFATALGKDARNPAFHFNLGDAFLKNGDPAKAIEEYESVDQSPTASPDLKFKAMFNAGNASVQNKDIPNALSYYQRALGYKPDSGEVKTNIELALKEQQGGGGGQKDQKKDQKNEDQNKEQQANKSEDKKDDKPQPKPFQSQALNENDVRRILEELKRQEEQIRARQNIDNRKTPEKQVDKDW